MKQYIIFMLLDSSSNSSPGRLIPVKAQFADTLDEAKQIGAQRAGEVGEPFYICRLIGFQAPTYDPDIGWTESKVPDA